ncbi:hypothetical protein TNCV_2326271 [Trichonephila clavipes]|nr:hypothetical protein TNCV_2326271 [Trichonephila clavipes]
MPRGTLDFHGTQFEDHCSSVTQRRKNHGDHMVIFQQLSIHLKKPFAYLVGSACCRVLLVVYMERKNNYCSLANTNDETESSTEGKTHPLLFHKYNKNFLLFVHVHPQVVAPVKTYLKIRKSSNTVSICDQKDEEEFRHGIYVYTIRKMRKNSDTVCICPQKDEEEFRYGMYMPSER